MGYKGYTSHRHVCDMFKSFTFTFTHGEGGRGGNNLSRDLQDKSQSMLFLQTLGQGGRGVGGDQVWSQLVCRNIYLSNNLFIYSTILRFFIHVYLINFFKVT